MYKPGLSVQYIYISFNLAVLYNICNTAFLTLRLQKGFKPK